jgi:hypothetical protein
MYYLESDILEDFPFGYLGFAFIVFKNFWTQYHL